MLSSLSTNSAALLPSLGVGLLALCAHRYFIHERIAIKERLDGKPRKILITGAGSGIGKATAELFHKKGWSVGIADFNLNAAQALAQQLGDDRAVALSLDVTDPNSCAQVVQTFCGDSRGLDALFNCAGLLAIGMFKDLNLKRQTNQIRVNFEGVVNMTHAALPQLKLVDQSVIVSMASSAAQSGVPTHAVYAATKAAVYSFTEALAIELNEDHVRVADVSVGYVATPMVFNQENRNSVALKQAYATPESVALLVHNAVYKARLHREHFYSDFFTLFSFRMQAFCRAFGLRFGMRFIAFFCMPTK